MRYRYLRRGDIFIRENIVLSPLSELTLSACDNEAYLWSDLAFNFDSSFHAPVASHYTMLGLTNSFRFRTSER